MTSGSSFCFRPPLGSLFLHLFGFFVYFSLFRAVASPFAAFIPLLCRSCRGGKGVIALKFKKALDDSLACFRVVGPDDEIMLSTFQVHIIRS